MSPQPIDNASMTERQLQQKAFEVSYYRNQAQELQGQVQILQQLLQEIANTQKSLAATAAMEDGTLVPMGAGVYAKAKAEKTGTVLIDVGSRVLLEKKPDDASKILDTRKAMVEQNLADLMAAFEKAATRAEQLAAQAEKMAQQSGLG